MRPFKPNHAGTVSLAATTTSSNVALLGVGAGSEYQLRIFNAGPATAFIARGDANTVTATTGGYPVPPGAIEVITCPASIAYVAAICASGSATLYLSTGEGV